MKIIKKPWGQEEILESNKNYTIKRLTMLSGHKCSKQYHNYKKETIYILSGILTIEINNKDIDLIHGQTFTLNPKDIHRMIANYEDVIYLECSTSELDDVIRIEDDYDRK